MPIWMRRSALVVGALLVLYVLAGFLVAPGLIRAAILRNLDRTLTTRATLGRVRFNPLVLSLTLEHLAVDDAGGRPVAGLERLVVRLDPLGSLVGGAPTLAVLRLERPSLSLEILPDRTLNLAHLLRPQSVGPDTAGSVPKFAIRRLQILSGSLQYGDRSREAYFRKRLEPIHLELTDFGTRRESRNAYSLEARTEAGERLSWRGRFQLQPFRSDGELHVGDLQAATLADLLEPTTPWVLARGTFSFDARYRVDAARTPAEVALSDLHVGARDLAVGDRASGIEVITARELSTGGGTLDAGRGELDLGPVSAHDGHVRVWMRADGHLNFESWAQATADTSKPMVVRVPSARLEGLALEFEDQRLRPPAILRVRGGDVHITDFSSAPGSAFATVFACSLGVAGHAEGRGTVTPAGPSAQLQVDLAGFELRDVQPWVRAFMRLNIVSGTADVHGRLAFGTFGPRGPLLRFTGDAVSRQFASTDQKVGDRLLAWRALELHGLEYDAVPGRIALREVVALQPFARVIVASDRTTNLQALQVPPDSVPTAFRPVPGSPDTMPVRIDLVRVSDGSLRFADLTLRPNFSIGIQALDGAIRELSSAEAAHADVQLEGKVDAYAPARIAGTLNPLNSRGRSDLTVSFKNIELTSFTPYSGKFMGYKIEKGKLDLELNYRIQDRQLDAQNRVFMRQLTLGDKVPSPDATHLPVRFAVALLKDKDGNIDLNLPVKGSLDDPKFSVLPILVKVLIGLVTKAVASPFALLHAAFGGGDHESPAVAFAYGSAELDTSQVGNLAAVRKGLGEHAALRLEIEEAGDAPHDSLALLEGRFDEALRAAAAPAVRPPDAVELAAARALAPAAFEPGEYFTSLTRAFVARFGQAPRVGHRAPKDAPPDPAQVAAEAARLRGMEERVRGSIRLDPTEVSGLARRRARRIQGYLLADSTIAPERVFIVGNKGTYRPDSLGVKVGLTLTD